MTIEKVLAAVAIALATLPTLAGPTTFSFASGNRSASVEFARTGGDLIVTPPHTSTADELVPTDILTADFFEVLGNPILSRTAAVVPLGKSVLVGGEWSYENSITEAAEAADQAPKSPTLTRPS